MPAKDDPVTIDKKTLQNNLATSQLLQHMAGEGHNPHNALSKILSSLQKLEPSVLGPIERYIPAKQTGPTGTAIVDSGTLAKYMEDASTLCVEDREATEKGFFAASYSTTQTTSLLETYKWTTRTICFEYVYAMLNDLQRGSLLHFYSNARGLIEKVSNAALLDDELTALFSKYPPDVRRISSIGEFMVEVQDKVASRGRATRYNWDNMYSKESIRLKKVLRPKESYGLDSFEAKDLLRGVDTLGKEILGLRNAYEFLCEFVHPNVGQSELFISSFFEEDAPYGIDYVTRQYSTKSQVVTWGNFSKSNMELLELTAELLEFFEGVDARLRSYIGKTSRLSKQYARQVLRSKPEIFPAEAWCPCGSCLPIFKCCGKKIRNKFATQLSEH
jgi:hypothetical protein